MVQGNNGEQFILRTGLFTQFKNGPLLSTSIGEWLEAEGRFGESIPHIWERRKNLKGQTVIATSLTWIPISIAQEDGSFTGLIPEAKSSVSSRPTSSFIIDT